MIRIAPLMFLALAACSGPDSGSAASAVKTFPATGFDRVDLKSADGVTIETGKDFSVTAAGRPDDLAKLSIAVDSGALTIDSNGFSVGHGGTPKIRITLPKLGGARIDGSGAIAIDHLEDDFTGIVAGSGALSIADFDGGKLALSIPGSGVVSVAGSAREANLSLSGSGVIKATDLKVQHADVRLSGSGAIRASVTGTANVRLDGSGVVDLGPDARCEVTNTGGGAVRCGG